MGKILFEDFDVEKRYDKSFYDEYIKNSKQQEIRKPYIVIKRLLDIVISFSFLVVAFIPFIIIGIAIKLDTKGPIIFKNRRVGKDGKLFNCLKFRSMVVEAPPEVATSLYISNQYVTKVGKFLRKTSIDELPQFFNVLIGQMSIIGYRPLVPSEKECNDMREKLGVFRMKPGISGFAQVNGRDDVYEYNKAILDSYYVNHASILFDLKLIFESAVVVLTGKSNWDK